MRVLFTTGFAALLLCSTAGAKSGHSLTETDLLADQAGVATRTDPDLLNASGLVFASRDASSAGPTTGTTSPAISPSAT